MDKPYRHIEETTAPERSLLHRPVDISRTVSSLKTVGMTYWVSFLYTVSSELLDLLLSFLLNPSAGARQLREVSLSKCGAMSHRWKP